MFTKYNKKKKEHSQCKRMNKVPLLILDIESIINTYYEQHYENKFTKLDEIQWFFEKWTIQS